MIRLACLLILVSLVLALMPCENCGPYPWLGVSADPKLDRLMTAIELKDGPMVRRLLDTGGIDLRAMDDDGVTPLTRAAQRYWADGCRLLIARGADVNALDKNGRTALHYAVFWAEPQALELVDLLIRCGADPDIRGRQGNTPLHDAAEYGRPDVLERLLRVSRDVNATDQGGFTPLHRTAVGDRPENAALLLRYGADPGRRPDTPSGARPPNRMAKHRGGGYGGAAEWKRLVVRAEVGRYHSPEVRMCSAVSELGSNQFG